MTAVEVIGGELAHSGRPHELPNHAQERYDVSTFRSDGVTANLTIPAKLLTSAHSTLMTLRVSF